jgi:hypothetical protein
MMVMVVVVTVLRKSGRREEHDHGEQQSLFHVQIIATKAPCQGQARVNFWGIRIGPNTIRSVRGVLFCLPYKESIA